MADKNQLKEFIEKLPATREEKQALVSQLDNGQEDAVKKEIKKILEETAEQFNALSEFDEAAQQLKAEIMEADKEAKDLAKVIGKQDDKKALEEARKKVS